MVDILLLRWFMRCKLLVVLDVFIDVYVTPFIYDLFWSNYYATTYVGDMGMPARAHGIGTPGMYSS
jgi:hypothetical protein